MDVVTIGNALAPGDSDGVAKVEGKIRDIAQRLRAFTNLAVEAIDKGEDAGDKETGRLSQMDTISVLVEAARAAVIELNGVLDDLDTYRRRQRGR
jgi:hypothetical protein